jgi:hypothetical protein
LFRLPRIAGTIEADVSGLLDRGAISSPAWLAIWRALASCEPGWQCRISIGDADRCGPSPDMDDVLSAPISIDVAGTHPDGVKALIAALRRA